MNGYMVLKIGSKEALTAFRERGQIYAKTLGFFAGLENDSERADPVEIVDHFHDPTGWRVSYTIPATAERVTLDDSRIRAIATHSKRYSRLNAFCMYSISLKNYPEIPPVDPRVLSFGRHFVMVLNPSLFFERVTKECAEKEIRCDSGLVTYINPTAHRGRRSPFQKPERFRYQSEFRFIFEPRHPQDPLVISVGDLSDITTPVSESSHLLNLTITVQS